MGTSGSYSGSGTGRPLLPPWADGDEYESVGPGVSPDVSPDGGAGQDVVQPEGDLMPRRPSPRVTGALGDARAYLRQYGASGGRENLVRASRSYVRGVGGPGNAARAARAGRATTRRLGGFLSDLARGGVPVAFDRVELQPVVGRPVGEVLAAVEDFLAPDGSSLDEGAARGAMSATLRDLYQQYGLEDEGIDGLNAMDAEGVRSTLQLYVANYIYEQMLSAMYNDLAGEDDVGEDQLVRAEREIRAFTRQTVKLELDDIDVLGVDWYEREGDQIAMRIFEQAYAVWGAMRP
jgi:hypothetical protein